MNVLHYCIPEFKMILPLLLLLLQVWSTSTDQTSSLFAKMVLEDLHDLLPSKEKLAETVRLVHLGQVGDEQQAQLIRCEG